MDSRRFPFPCAFVYLPLREESARDRWGILSVALEPGKYLADLEAARGQPAAVHLGAGMRDRVEVYPLEVDCQNVVVLPLLIVIHIQQDGQVYFCAAICKLDLHVGWLEGCEEGNRHCELVDNSRLLALVVNSDPH